jgi:beta-galactosidase
VDEVRDRAQVFLDQRAIGVLARDHHDRALALPDDARGVLELLVEDQGRVDYGPRIGEPKGLIGPATVNGERLEAWQVLPLNLDDIEPVAKALRAAHNEARDGRAPLVAGPAFARATFDAPEGAEISDLFLDTLGWGKGVAWINGFPLGRYWSRGPQRTLYVPAPVLRETGNELVVFELHATTSAEVRLLAKQELGHTDF